MKLIELAGVKKLDQLNKDELTELQTNLQKLGYYQGVDGILGKRTKSAWAAFKEKNFLSDPDLIGKSSINLLISKANSPTLPLISVNKFKQVFSGLTDRKINQYYPNFILAIQLGNIDTFHEISAFLAQLHHESAGLVFWEEIADGSAYEGRRDLGNVHAGDGKRFKGHGPIQITGRTNHKLCGDFLGLDLIKNPKLITLPEYGFKSAIWFWSAYKGLNKYCNGTESGFKLITKRINGGYNGLEDRIYQWNRAKEILSKK